VRFEGRLPREGINVSPSHPLGELLRLLAGVIGLALALVVGAALALDWLIPKIPPALELRLFAGLVPAELTRADPPDPRQAALAALLARLERHWPGGPELRVFVIDDPDPNAMALPGGWIGVTDGLLAAVGSENELALVIGHELGHFRHRDHLRGLGRGIAAALVLGELGGGGELLGGLGGLAIHLAERGFDREQERAADLFGLELVEAEYGHVAGAFDFFARLPEDGNGRLAGYLSTHPLHAERIEALRREARRRGWPLEGALTPLALP
jgi:Zn-dependent protease with chaperone function